MVVALRAARRLGLAVLLVVGAACGGEGPARTEPTRRVERVASCPKFWSAEELQLPVWDLLVRGADWDALHADIYADVEVPAQLCIDGELETIGLELQGSSNRSRDKKSFKIKFARDHELARVGFEGDRHESIDKVYLKAFWGDQSLIREAVSFDLWREMGHIAPQTAFANLRINGDYWGLYAVVEPVDKDYLRRNGYPPAGRLYKATRKNGSRADFSPGRDLEQAFEDKSDAGEPFDDLKTLVAALQDTDLDLSEFEREIDPIFPLADYLDRMIWVSFTRNGDAVAQNFYLYNAPRDGRDFWYQIPWDSDLCLGSSWRDRDAVVAPEVSLMLKGGTYFAERLTMIPELSQRYTDRFREVLDHVLEEPVLMAYLDERASHVRADLLQDQLRWQRNIIPDDAFDVIRDFLTQRPSILRAAIDQTWPD